MDWNARYEANDTPWDKGSPTPVLDEIYQRHPDVFVGMSILVPGCGTGHDARWLAAQGAHATGVDISPLAITKALALDQDGQATYEIADFLDSREPLLKEFDQIWEHTCFCALDPSLRGSYVAAAYRSLKPRGTLIGVFFIDPEMDEGEMGPPFGIGVNELKATFLIGGFQLIEDWVPSTGYPGRLGRELVMILRRPM
jgi:SAM-dependent methyltransferase